MPFTQTISPISPSPGLPYNFDAYPAQHADGVGGGAVFVFPPQLDPDQVADHTDYEITFSVTVTGSPQETSIYWGGGLPGAGTVYRRVGGVVQVNASPVLTLRLPGYSTSVVLWWTKHGVGADPDAATFIRITVTQVRAIVTWSTLVVEFERTFALSVLATTAGIPQTVLGSITVPALAADQELVGGATWTWRFSLVGGDTINDFCQARGNPVFFLRQGGVTSIDERPESVETLQSWVTNYRIALEARTLTGTQLVSWQGTVTVRAAVRQKGADDGTGGGGGTGGATSLAGDGLSAAERILGLVTVDAVGLTGDPVDSGAATPSLFGDLHWVNGLEEAAVPHYATIDSLGAVWSAIENSPAGGLSIVAGIHGASQKAVRVTALADNSVRGGILKKNFPTTYSSGSVYARLYFAPVTTPGAGAEYGLVDLAANVGLAPFYVARLEWTDAQKLKLLNRAGSTVTSTGNLQTGDRIELRVTLGGSGSCEARIFTGDSTTARETISLSGDPAPGVGTNGAWFADSPTAATGGAYTLDDLGVSRVTWLGPGTVLLAKPTLDLAVEWGRVGSGAQNAEAVDDYPGSLDDTDYLQAATGSKRDRYGWTIVGADFAKPKSVVQALVTVARGAAPSGTANVRLRVWDDANREWAAGSAWGIAGASFSNVALDQQNLALDPKKRTVSKLGLWTLGIKSEPAMATEARVSVLHANLDVLEIA